jgi:hypothetical protein
MAQINPPVTEEKILEALRAEGITNLQELAQKSLEEANSKAESGRIDIVFFHPVFAFLSDFVGP